MDKYKILYDNKKEVYDDVFIYRIQALKDFSDVKAGDIGGYVQTENNLSQEGNCWIYDDAIVYNNSKIIDNAKVCNKAILADNAIVMEDAIVKDEAYIVGNGNILGKAIVSEYAYIEDFSLIKDATILGTAEISNSEIVGNVIVKSGCRVTDCRISTFDNTIEKGKVIIEEHSWIKQCEIYGYDIIIKGDGLKNEIRENAKIYCGYLTKSKVCEHGLILDDDMCINIEFPGFMFSGTIYLGDDKQLYHEGESLYEQMIDKDNWENEDIDLNYKILDLVKMVFNTRFDLDIKLPTREEIGI